MKKIVIIIFALIGLDIAWTQATNQTKQYVDSKAESLLSEAHKKIQNSNAINVNISIFTHEKQNNKKETTKATLLFWGDKYQLAMGENILYCNGTTVWHLNKGVNEVTINNADPKEDHLINPTKLLLNYKKYYRAVRATKSGTNTIVELVPNKKMDYFKVKVTISNATLLINKIDVLYTNGTVIAYTLSGYKLNVKTNPMDFMFKNTNNQYEVIDMR